MSSDPATFVAGVPVKISERYRPHRKITLPAACHHHINTELLTQEYDFAIEKTTLQWVNDRRSRLEKEEKERSARIAQFDRLKAERLAKEEAERVKREEERVRLEEEAKERERVAREEQERLKQEEEERRAEEEERKKKEEEEEGEKDGEKDEEESEEPKAESGGDTDGETSKPDPDEEQQPAETQPSETPAASVGTPITTVAASTITTAPTTAPTTTAMTSSYDGNSPYPWMLQPTPIPKSSVRSPLKTPTNINFADFEGEANDPFDSAALKSINDMEELAKVLGTTNIGQTATNKSSDQPAKNNNQAFTNGQGAYSAYGGQYQYYPQHQQQQQQQQQHVHQPRQQGFSQYGNPQATSANTSSSVSYTSTTSQYAQDMGQNFQNPYYSQQWNSGYNNSPRVPYDYRLQTANIANAVSSAQGIVSPANSQSFATSQAGNPGTMTYANSSSTSAQFTSTGNPSTNQGGNLQSFNNASADPTRTPNKRPDLEDFYSKYYSQNKNVSQGNQWGGTGGGGAQSGESTPSHSSSSGAAGGSTSGGSLRSCRSVPDLTAPEDSEVGNISTAAHHSDSRGFSHTPPPRPNSTGLTGLEDWKPLPDIPGLEDSNPLPTQPSPPTTTKPLHHRLPDPFTDLTTDAQALVQNMAEMGFPRPRVARAVQKLGTDHKKLLEVLLVLQSLQENGEDGYKAERAFYHYMGDVQKTKDHVAAAKQLLDLGFEEGRIVDALLKHDNDRDKALEELIV